MSIPTILVALDDNISEHELNQLLRQIDELPGVQFAQRLEPETSVTPGDPLRNEMLRKVNRILPGSFPPHLRGAINRVIIGSDEPGEASNGEVGVVMAHAVDPDGLFKNRAKSRMYRLLDWFRFK